MDMNDQPFQTTKPCECRHGTPQVFDEEGFINRMMGDEEFARKVVRSFVKQLPAMLTELKQSLSSGSTDSIRHSLHKIKGSAANIGGEAVSALALQMERTNQSAALTNMAADLERQAELLIHALNTWAK